MKTKARKPRLSIVDAVYSAIADFEDASDKLLIRHVSKLCGKTVTASQFQRALKSIATRP
jgi:hypothetical protein